ncbi:MAG: TauD/TfdA family dioxygenase [Rhodospirillaceae bacterium]|jgi:taurine dioxygenase|nr:TauD/TfdA family dioxygenase [Rhodospirillaceae bacterium]MBT5665716.1 TauD/TfdA family dioxygenase [Rhodospirillaceae bacterium]MBT5812435.1 TauD/TfdA family dioxygenase [Rhodospirillaceae bacterium]
MLHIQPMGANTGGEITGVDVKQLDDEGFAPIYATWLKYGVIVVRDQEIEIDDFLDYSRRFGTVVPHPSKSTRHPDYPEITLLGINKFDADGNLIEAIYRRGGVGFHTDGAYDDVPFKATQLHAIAVPSTGGNTHFSNMYMAHDALPQRLKQTLEGRNGAFTYGGRSASQALLNEEDRDRKPAFHPMIRLHSETGRKSLYFDPGKILYIDGLEKQQSDDVIDELAERMLAPGAQYSHQWRVGDIVIWDNRCMVHKAAGDYPPEEDRIHWRVSIKEPAAA